MTYICESNQISLSQEEKKTQHNFSTEFGDSGHSVKWDANKQRRGQLI